ncbi:MAG: SBBP repeat-containing protein [Planctomycetota bacterium]|nr:SBBP repeat-containing protein [Planctomycetota bacterium]
MLLKSWLSTVTRRANWVLQLSRSVSENARRKIRRSPWIAEFLEDRTLLSPNFGFAAGFGAAGEDIGLGVVADADGNVYVVGDFEGTVDFDPGPSAVNLISAGGSDAFVAKYDDVGALIWARRLGGGGNDSGLAIALDDNGNVYTTGSFAGTADFDPGANAFDLVSAGVNDAFVMHVDATSHRVRRRTTIVVCFDSTLRPTTTNHPSARIRLPIDRLRVTGDKPG